MAGPAERRRRVSRLAKGIRSAGQEGVIICPGPNLTYYTGVRAQLLERPFLFLVQKDRTAHLLAPKLEAGPFKESGEEMSVHEWDDTYGPKSAFEEMFRQVDWRAEWGCEGRVPFAFLHHLETRGMRLEPADEMLQAIRAVKGPEELESLRRAAKILAGTYLKIPGLLQEGIAERELARLIVGEALDNGAESMEMCMVQSGSRAADPHSDSSSKKIKRGESVVIDAVCFYDGYAADITRTFAIGRNAPFEKVYESVLSAQRKAISAAREGVEVGEVDAAARGSLRRDGLGDLFIHRTGHGLGLEVHEAPFIVASGRERLSKGMVFTVEPGAYLPGRLGVRIEDDLIVGDGKEVITSDLPKELGWWR
jgi:Xaa-Pro dipeptidase